MPTLQTIADLAGVSRATVSLALRNHPSLPTATCERLQKIAGEVGYKANPLISSLMSHLRATRKVVYQGTIAFLTNYPTRDGWAEIDTYRRFFTGARDRAHQAGYGLEEHWLKERGMTSQKMNQILYARGISGVLISPLLGKGHLSLDMTNLASVTFGLSMKLPDIHRVDNNQIDTMRKTLRELKRRGYRRVGLAFQSWEDEHVDHNWSTGYLGYCQHGTLAPDIPIYRPKVHSSALGLAWLGQHRVDAVVTISTHALDIFGGRENFPPALGYAVVDRVRSDEGIAGIDQRPELSGSAAIDMLLGQINRNERGIPAAPKLLLTQGIWVDGDSVRAPLYKVPPGQKIRQKAESSKRNKASSP